MLYIIIITSIYNAEYYKCIKSYKQTLQQYCTY